MMAVAFAFVLVEYCTQSHLSTVDYADAARGLRRTRVFKKHTYFCRRITEYLIECGKSVSHKMFGRYVRRERRSLVWTWKTRYPAIYTSVIEESRLRGEGEGMNEEVSFFDGGGTDGGETDGGETVGGETDGETDASADIPLE